MNSDEEEESVSEVSEDDKDQQILPQLEDNYKLPESINKYQDVSNLEGDEDDEEDEDKDLGLGSKLWASYEQMNKKNNPEEPVRLDEDAFDED